FAADWALHLEMGEVVLLQDCLEEAGLRLKCRALAKLGRMQQALQCYQKYVKDYTRFLNTKPNLSFEDLFK
ncbi:MAG: hypothetical protein LBL81_05365, partial [Tannerella sp.]|nr:hypothetical protein [Tannerella sp.]